jgi:hypothetical protein
MEPAGDVGRRDQSNEVGVDAVSVPPEALAEIGVEIEAPPFVGLSYAQVWAPFSDSPRPPSSRPV